MLKLTKFLASLWFLMFLIPSTADSGTQQSGSACQLVERALADYGHLSVGITRRDIPKNFVPDGGAQFASKTRFVHAECKYLHVDVEFDLFKPDSIQPSPEDKVARVSKLYVEWPAKD